MRPPITAPARINHHVRTCARSSRCACCARVCCRATTPSRTRRDRRGRTNGSRSVRIRRSPGRCGDSAKAAPRVREVWKFHRRAHRQRNDCRVTRARACYTPGPSSKRLSGMCLILFAYRVRADAPLIVAANRDEFYARPAALAHRWADAPRVRGSRSERRQRGSMYRRAVAAAVPISRNVEDGFHPVRAASDRAFLRGRSTPRARTIDDDPHRGSSAVGRHRSHLRQSQLASACARAGRARAVNTPRRHAFGRVTNGRDHRHHSYRLFLNDLMSSLRTTAFLT